MDYKVTVQKDDFELAKQIACQEKEIFGCSQEFYDRATNAMRRHGWDFPIDADEAKTLYLNLCDQIRRFAE